MINRINLILRAKNITARQFAEEIGIQPSGMSHILGGRNNPSLEFVSKVLRRYPEIDANWLLLGRGEMYSGMKNEELRMKNQEQVTEPTLFSAPEAVPSPAPVAPVTEPQPVMEPAPEPEALPIMPEEVAPTSGNPENLQDVSPLRENPEVQKMSGLTENLDGGKQVERILFFYSDHTFQEYRPGR